MITRRPARTITDSPTVPAGDWRKKPSDVGGNNDPKLSTGDGISEVLLWGNVILQADAPVKESATLANTPSFNIIGTASSVDAIPLFSIIGAQDLPSMPHVEVIDQQTAQDPVTPRSTTFSMIGGMHGAALRTTPLLFTMLK